MKVSYEQCVAFSKTKSAPSLIVRDLWIARSGIAIQLGDRMQPVFGFAAGYDRQKCEMRSFYELLEHLVFLPYLYDEESASKMVFFVSEKLNSLDCEERRTIQEFLIGSSGPKGIFYGNGCAIFTDIAGAVLHSQREYLERHICCEVWYHRTRPLFQELQLEVEILNSAVALNIYRADTGSEGIFSIATLDCDETGFFAMGAAIRTSLEEAYKHAVGEVAMLFEDAKKGRSGVSTTVLSQKKILSLRDRKTSKVRKLYFQHLVNRRALPSNDPIVPVCQTVVFEPFPKLYAARTFSEDSMDPRWFETRTDLPIMPLF